MVQLLRLPRVRRFGDPVQARRPDRVSNAIMEFIVLVAHGFGPL